MAAPTFGDTSPGFMPDAANYAWLQEIIKVNLNKSSLPESIKKDLLTDMEPYINYASMMKITRGQVIEFLNGFDELWMRFRIFRIERKYTHELNYVMSYIRELFIMGLNRSVDGWQGDHVFERKTSTDLRLVRTDYIQALKHRFLRRNPPPEQGAR